MVGPPPKILTVGSRSIGWILLRVRHLHIRIPHLRCRYSHNFKKTKSSRAHKDYSSHFANTPRVVTMKILEPLEVIQRLFHGKQNQSQNLQDALSRLLVALRQFTKQACKFGAFSGMAHWISQPNSLWNHQFFNHKQQPLVGFIKQCIRTLISILLLQS